MKEGDKWQAFLEQTSAKLPTIKGSCQEIFSFILNDIKEYIQYRTELETRFEKKKSCEEILKKWYLDPPCIYHLS